MYVDTRMWTLHTKSHSLLDKGFSLFTDIGECCAPMSLQTILRGQLLIFLTKNKEILPKGTLVSQQRQALLAAHWGNPLSLLIWHRKNLVSRKKLSFARVTPLWNDCDMKWGKPVYDTTHLILIYLHSISTHPIIIFSWHLLLLAYTKAWPVNPNSPNGATSYAVIIVHYIYCFSSLISYDQRTPSCCLGDPKPHI